MEKVRVLIAEGNDELRTQCTQILRRQGINVIGEAADGQDALVKITRLKPGVVISDMHLAAVVAAVGVLGVLLLWDKLMGVLQNYLAYGMDDNGRFDIWRIGWKNFTDYPIFGAGFYNSFAYEGWQKDVYPYLYHNTVLQMAATGGVLLLGAYLYHRVTTVLLVVKQPSAGKTFLGICILGLISFSLLDVIFFNTYPTIIYSLMLLFMDRESVEAR